MKETKYQYRAFCIIGMHRSGTSVVARLLNIMGAYLGEDADIMNPQPDNPEGFWERNDIVRLNDRILQHYKMTWQTPRPLPDKWYLSEEIIPFRNEIINLIRKNFIGYKLWAWKDPRTSILLPLWKNVLDELGIQLSCIFVIRNPLDVAKSLKKRNEIPFDKSFGLWFNYNITALQASVDIHRVFVSYDAIINNCKKELKKCVSGLEIPCLDNNLVLEEYITSFVRPDLRHSISGVDDLEKYDAPLPVITLYNLLEDASSSSINTNIMPQVEQLFQDFTSYSRFYCHDVSKLLTLGQLLIEKDKQLLDKDLIIESIIHSASWKITYPLRIVHTLYRRIIVKGRLLSKEFGSRFLKRLTVGGKGVDI